MAINATERERLTRELATKEICRFCLSQLNLGSIYGKDVRFKVSAPLTMQIMACASIEVMADDGMPSKICCECRILFEFSYRFKQMCKKADTQLRQVPLTGMWPQALPKPKYPMEFIKKLNNPQKNFTNLNQIISKSGATASPSPTITKKLLNANPAPSPEPPAPKRLKKEKLDVETEEIIFLNKVENDEELSLDDVQRLIAATEVTSPKSGRNDTSPQKASQKPKPVVLNKSKVRILNKEANQSAREPRFSVPQLKCNDAGNVEIVTEMLHPNLNYDGVEDSIKNAEPVETNVFPCPHCERSFPLVQLRDIHVVNHNRERSFHCPDCEKSFFSKYDLQKHTLTHTGDRPFKCTACYKSFTRATLLHRHEKVHTDIPKFICVYCEKQFLSKKEMEKHTERHLKKRPFPCRVCNKSFAFKQGLDRHEVIHLRDQPYPCQYCYSSFSTPSKLARHLTAHAGKRPYPCKFCNKSYLLSHHLTRHMRSHKAGKVTFDCTECGKNFKTRDYLVAHSQSEHLRDTLTCPLCKEEFDEVDDIADHIKKHAEGDAHACEFCDLFFLTGRQLIQHIESNHDVDMKAYRDHDEANADDDEPNKSDDNDDELVTELDKEKVMDDEAIEEEFNKLVKEEQNDDELPNTSDRKSLPVALNKGLKRKAATRIKVEDEEEEADTPPQAVKRSPRIMANRRSGGGGDVTKQDNIEVIAPPKRKEPIHIKHNIVISPPTRSVANKSNKDTAQLKQPLIDKVLNSLPKSLSVRKNLSSAGSSTVPVHNASGLAETLKGTTAKSIGNIEEMVVNNKKVKVQRILISPDEAELMAKEGRLHMKDGNILLTSKNGKNDL